MIEVGNTIMYQLYNGPSKSYYGEKRMAQIMKFDPKKQPVRDFTVIEVMDFGIHIHTIWEHEIIAKVEGYGISHVR